MQTLINKIRAGYPGIYLITHEELRAEAMLLSVANTINFALHSWSIINGRIDAKSGQQFDQQDPMELLQGIGSLPEQTILILRDFHLLLKEPNPALYRLLKDAMAHCKMTNKTLVLLAPEFSLPTELAKLFSVEEFSLPTREELRDVLERFCNSTGKTFPSDPLLDSVLDSALGLTTSEAEDAFALSIIETGDFSPPVISREKASAAKKNGLLEIIDSPVRLDDIGGLDILKADLVSKRNLFTRAARDYGLTSPRGILTVGQAGTGKSLTAQASGSIFGIPTIKVEGGSIFGGIVGQSEANWRAIFATAKAIAPCVLWIDEADGLFSGYKSGGSSDSGTTNRVIKAILQDMQFNSDGIFYVFTANDIDGFPDALIDRLDVWSVDLPNPEEREAIWAIHIAKRKRDPRAFDLATLATETDGFSGRQIEQVWMKALTLAFNENREPSMSDILTATGMFTATSKTMADAIESRRRRLKGKATPASSPITTLKVNGRKIAA